MAELNYKHLRYFWAVAHQGNLTRAALELGVSQSAVSVQIHQLEGQLGTPLFERRGRQLVLTEAGHIALDHADRIFSVGDSLVETLREGSGAARRVLRVGALATLSRNFQLRFLEPLLGRDDVEIVIRSGTFRTLVLDLDAHRLDVVLCDSVGARDADTPWVPHVIADQPVALIGHADRPAAGRDWRTILAEEPLVLPSVESGIRTGFDALVYRLGIRPRVAAEVDDMAMLRLLVRRNVGYAVAPPIVVRDELESGLLLEVERFAEIHETFYAITLTRHYPNPLLRSLMPGGS